MPQQKVAVLGGGVSALTTVYEMTNQPDWQSKYNITVYQMGWRLGGKGASGRNPDEAFRIEEHGLHIWMGFYTNAFKMMRNVYDILQRPSDAPLSTLEKAFKPHSFCIIEEKIGEEWKSWIMNFNTNYKKVGEGNETLTIWEIVKRLLDWLEKPLQDFIFNPKPALANLLESVPSLAQALLKTGAKQVNSLAEFVSPQLGKKSEELSNEILHYLGMIYHDTLHYNSLILKETFSLLRDIGFDMARFLGQLTISDVISQTLWYVDKQTVKGSINKAEQSVIISMMREIRLWANENLKHYFDTNDDKRRLWILLNLITTGIIGIFEDGVIEANSWDVINEYNLNDWLRRHGADEKVINSAFVIAMYDFIFAYENGNINKPNVEAGSALRTVLKGFFEYRGAVMYKMQAGMGDTVFAPLYTVLKQRGVKFKFFHRLEDVHIGQNSDGESIVTALTMSEQVRLKPGAKEYKPLISVNNLDCWPSVPLYRQLHPEDAEALQKGNVNLESYWADWKNAKTIRLEHGKDFDIVVFGISLGSIPHLCKEILADKNNPKFARMVAEVKTVATQAFQVWLNEDLSGIGWDHQSPVLSTFVEPMDTWADMTDLIPREQWDPQGDTPYNIAYFCGVMPDEDPSNIIPPPTERDFPQRNADHVKKNAIKMLNEEIKPLWKTCHKSHSKEFDWSLLVKNGETTKPNGKYTEKRFDTQFWRSNVEPSERYVLSVAGSSKYRLKANESGYKNLYLTGDWIQNGMNVGCVEAAVMAGMHTSRAICGFPKVIVGEKGLG